MGVEGRGVGGERERGGGAGAKGLLNGKSGLLKNGFTLSSHACICTWTMTIACTLTRTLCLSLKVRFTSLILSIQKCKVQFKVQLTLILCFFPFIAHTHPLPLGPPPSPCSSTLLLHLSLQLILSSPTPRHSIPHSLCVVISPQLERAVGVCECWDVSGGDVCVLVLHSCVLMAFTWLSCWCNTKRFFLCALPAF